MGEDKGGRTATETEHLDVIAQLAPGQFEEGGSEEHGLVVRVCDQEADALVPDDGEGAPRCRGRVEPCREEEDDERREEEEGGERGGRSVV